MQQKEVILWEKWLTFILSWFVGGGCLMTCFTVCMSVSTGSTLMELTRSTNNNWSSQVAAITWNNN